MPQVIRQVSAAADDGYWYSWASLFYNNYEYIVFGSGGDGHWDAWARFTGINIPAGAKIVSAYLKLYMYSGSPECNVYFNDVAAPTAPSSFSNADGKALTSNYVYWHVDGSGWTVSPNLAAPVQELVDSYAPYSNGAMMVLLKTWDSGPSDTGNARTYEYGDHSLAPILEISYAVGGKVRFIGVML